MEYPFEIAVVVLNWNAVEQTSECIQYLYSIKNFPLKIIVVDNGSTDSSVITIQEKFPNVHLICNTENLGFAGGNNCALREILASKQINSDLQQKCCRYVLLLNNDAGIDEKSLRVLVSTLERYDDVGVTGPVFVNKSDLNTVITAGGLDPSLHINTYQSGKKIGALLQTGSPFAVDYVSGTVALIRTSALEKSGIFEERYFFSGEMADLCYRMKDLEYGCYISPKAKAWHEMTMAGSRRNTLYLYYILRNRFLFIRRCKRKYLVPLYLLWIVLGIVVGGRSLLGGRFQSVRAIFLGLRDGVFGRYGGRNYLFSRVLDSEN